MEFCGLRGCDEWIGNWHVGIGWGPEVVRGKKM